jgi:hypothetical protein
MKPLHSKLFSMVDAQAGAPYGCADGASATVFKWDCRRALYKIAGVRGEIDESTMWTKEGRHLSGYGGDALVMLPLGMIDGKPVFVGDEFIWYIDKQLRVASPCMAGACGSWELCTWPAPAKVYPVSLMTFSELSDEYDRYHIHATSIRSMANAVLRHAIDAGQVIIAEVKS